MRPGPNVAISVCTVSSAQQTYPSSACGHVAPFCNALPVFRANWLKHAWNSPAIAYDQDETYNLLP